MNNAPSTPAEFSLPVPTGNGTLYDNLGYRVGRVRVVDLGATADRVHTVAIGADEYALSDLDLSEADNVINSKVAGWSVFMDRAALPLR